MNEESLSDMSSWYVERLLLDRELIRARMFSTEKDPMSRENYLDSFANLLEDDTYLDLLSVEDKIQELIKNDLLSSQEIKILDLVLEGYTISDILQLDLLNRKTVHRVFKSLCGKIAFYLGGHFTDEGYINYMVNKYKSYFIDEEHVQMLVEYLNKDYRHSKI